jgi:hypothetical protein
MPEISANTLVVVIQSLNQTIGELVKVRNDRDTEMEERADLDELILSHQKAAQELKTAYAEARRVDPTLPHYGWLTQPQA